MKETAWVIGASTGLGRQTAEMLAKQGVSVILSSRNQRDLDALCQHLKLKYQVEANVFILDLEQIISVAESKICLDKLLVENKFPDSCYILAGSVHDRDEHLQAIEILNPILQNNFTGPVLLMNELLVRKQKNPLRLIVASTIAAARARSKNIAYSTAKRALEQYCFGLMHSQAQSNVTIHIYRFGYLDTNLTYGQKLLFPAADASSIASKMIKDSGKGPGLFYLPKYWYWICLVLNLVPFSIYKKLKF